MAKCGKIQSGKVSRALAQEWSRELHLRTNQITTQRPQAQLCTASACGEQILREGIPVGLSTGGVTGFPLKAFFQLAPSTLIPSGTGTIWRLIMESFI